HGRRDGLGLFRTEEGGIPEASDGPSKVSGAEGVHAVLDQSEAMVSAQTECSVQVRRNAKGVLKDQRLRPRRDSPSGLRQVHVPVVRLTVDVNWPGASVTDCVGDDDMGGRGDQNLITGSNVEGTKQPIETNTAGRKTGSEAHSDEAREGGLVFGYRRALDGASGPQQEPHRRRNVTPA